jgi:hypothetical protein
MGRSLSVRGHCCGAFLLGACSSHILLKNADRAGPGSTSMILRDFIAEPGCPPLRRSFSTPRSSSEHVWITAYSCLFSLLPINLGLWLPQQSHDAWEASWAWDAFLFGISLDFVT